MSVNWFCAIFCSHYGLSIFVRRMASFGAIAVPVTSLCHKNREYLMETERQWLRNWRSGISYSCDRIMWQRISITDDKVTILSEKVNPWFHEQRYCFNLSTTGLNNLMLSNMLDCNSHAFQQETNSTRDKMLKHKKRRTNHSSVSKISDYRTIWILSHLNKKNYCKWNVTMSGRNTSGRNSFFLSSCFWNLYI